MATWILADCINCGACAAPGVCPNDAITDGTDVADELSQGVYYIHPDLCSECVGEADHAQCDVVCPVSPCCVENPNIIEDEATLAARAIALHPDDAVLAARIASGNFPSLKRKLPLVP